MPRWEPLDQEPRRIGEGLERVLPGGRAFTTLVERWSDLVGDNLASHARPSALHATTLVVAVDDPAWATQLRYLGSDLVARCSEALGAGVVTEVRIVVRPA